MRNKVIFFAGVIFLLVISGCGKSETQRGNIDSSQQTQENNEEVQQNNINAPSVDNANSGDGMIHNIADESDTDKNGDIVEYDVYRTSVRYPITKDSIIAMKPKKDVVQRSGESKVEIEKRCLVSDPEQCVCFMYWLMMDCDENLSDLITNHEEYTADVSSLNMSINAFFKQELQNAAANGQEDSLMKNEIQITRRQYFVNQSSRHIDHSFGSYILNTFDGVVRKYCLADNNRVTDECTCYFISGKVVPFNNERVGEELRRVAGKAIIVDEKGFSEYHRTVECDNN